MPSSSHDFFLENLDTELKDDISGPKTDLYSEPNNLVPFFFSYSQIISISIIVGRSGIKFTACLRNSNILKFEYLVISDTICESAKNFIKISQLPSYLGRTIRHYVFPIFVVFIIPFFQIRIYHPTFFFCIWFICRTNVLHVVFLT